MHLEKTQSLSLSFQSCYFLGKTLMCCGINHLWGLNAFLGLFWMCVLLAMCMCSLDVPLYMAAYTCLNSLRVLPWFFSLGLTHSVVFLSFVISCHRHLWVLWFPCSFYCSSCFLRLVFTLALSCVALLLCELSVRVTLRPAPHLRQPCRLLYSLWFKGRNWELGSHFFQVRAVLGWEWLGKGEFKKPEALAVLNVVSWLDICLVFVDHCFHSACEVHVANMNWLFKCFCGLTRAWSLLVCCTADITSLDNIRFC